jgi:predicted nucleic acid-binding protein
LTRFVVDASVALCWYFPRQKTAYTEAIFDRLAAGDVALAPALWPLEMVNSLVVAARQKAISLAQFDAFIADLQDLPVSVDLGGVGRSYSSIVRLCRQHQLSSYDAAYLDLALVEGIAIATLDRNLRAAARASGVELLPATS